MVAPPQSTRYGLVGTAFDYLLRMFLELLNEGKCESHRWVAELAIKGIPNLERDTEELLDLTEKAKHMLVGAIQTYENYLKEGMIDDELIKCCIHLAQLDGIHRAGRVEEDFGVAHEEDVTDLRNLIVSLTPADFYAFNHCILNPTFGEASQVIGGADADLILDSCLIDIKTTKYLNIKQEYYHQLVGYVLLSRTVDNVPPVRSTGLYFSRYAQMYKFPLEEMASEEMWEEFYKWFIDLTFQVDKA